MFSAILRTLQPIAKWDPSQHPRNPVGTAEGGQFKLVNQYGVTVPKAGLKTNTSTAEMAKEPLPKTLKQAEDRIRLEPNEHLFIVKNGVPVKYLGNDSKDTVEFPDDLLAGELIDAVVTHNHPSSNSLSEADGYTAVVRGLSEVRAVTQTGTYVLRRAGSEWPTNFDKQITAAGINTRAYFHARIANGTITPAEANAKHYDELWTRAALRTNGQVVYTFEPNS